MKTILTLTLVLFSACVPGDNLPDPDAKPEYADGCGPMPSAPGMLVSSGGDDNMIMPRWNYLQNTHFQADVIAWGECVNENRKYE